MNWYCNDDDALPGVKAGYSRRFQTESWVLNVLAAFVSEMQIGILDELFLHWEKCWNIPGVLLMPTILGSISKRGGLRTLDGFTRTLSITNRSNARQQLYDCMRTAGLLDGDLIEQLAPDCELDRDGSHIFDYGPRQFRFALRPGSIPAVRDATGNWLSNLPQPTESDDFDIAKSARKTWKLLKRQIREITVVQTARLERAMVDEHRWAWADFERIFCHNPVLRNLTYPLIWGVYIEDKVAATFRVEEDGHLSDAHEKRLTPIKDAQIGLVHPLHLSNAEIVAWGELLHDFEIMPLFPQMGRPIYRLTEEAIPGASELPGVKPFDMGTKAVRFTTCGGALAANMEKQNWIGVSEPFVRYFLHQKIQAVLRVVHSGGKDDRIGIRDCRFAPIDSSVRQKYEIKASIVSLIPKRVPSAPHRDKDENDALPLNLVPPIVISETLYDIHTIFQERQL